VCKSVGIFLDLGLCKILQVGNCLIIFLTQSQDCKKLYQM